MSAARSPHFPALAIAIVLLLVQAGLFRGFVVDDAFITYRYARSLAHGQGPSYNPGDRVEGFSNPVFTLMLAGLHPLVPDAERFPWLARSIGLLASLAGLVLLARVPVGTAWPGLALALILTGTSIVYALWSVAGLETGLHAFLILAAFLGTLARPRTLVAQLGLGGLLALVVLSRPEGVLTAAPLFTWRLIDSKTRRDWRGHSRVALGAALPVMLWVVFRAAWFGSLLPNTWFAKRLDPVTALQFGDWYVRGFVRDHGWRLLYLPAPLALWSPGARTPARLAALVMACYLPFIYVAGGDWMSHYRFFAPYFPFIALLVGLGWHELLRRAAAWGWRDRTAPRAFVPAGLAVAWLLLLITNVPQVRAQLQRPYVNASPYFDTLGRVIGRIAPPQWTVALHDIGAVGWYGGTRVLDLLGLVDRTIALKLVTPDSLVMARQPELVVLHYDNRTPRPRARWRPIEWPGFDSLYVVPRGDPQPPESFRVRRDVAALVERRLAALPPKLRADLARLNAHLVDHQPDMWPVVAPEP